METKDAVEQLIEKAAQSTQSHDAMHFSQAALNAAHARQVVKLLEKTV